jgi:hypothetical protein
MFAAQRLRRDVLRRCPSYCRPLRDDRKTERMFLAFNLPFNGEPMMTSMSRRQLMIAATGIAAVAATIDQMIRAEDRSQASVRRNISSAMSRSGNVEIISLLSEMNSRRLSGEGKRPR